MEPRLADFQNLIADAEPTGDWQTPIDPKPIHWHRMAWLQWRGTLTRGIALTRQEDVFQRHMSMLAGTPEFQADAEKHVVEFRVAMRARRVEALKRKADKLREGLKDWGVPIEKIAAHMRTPPGDTNEYRQRAAFEQHHGVRACHEAWAELQALADVESEITETERAPLGVLSAADDARRAERVKAARAQQSGRDSTADASATKSASKKVDRRAKVTV